MCEHAVARPPAGAAAVGPGWPPVTAAAAPRAAALLRVPAAHRPAAPQLSHRSPTALPPQALLLPRLPHRPAPPQELISAGSVLRGPTLPARSQKQKAVGVAGGLKAILAMGARRCPVPGSLQRFFPCHTWLADNHELIPSLFLSLILSPHSPNTPLADGRTEGSPLPWLRARVRGPGDRLHPQCRAPPLLGVSCSETPLG